MGRVVCLYTKIAFERSIGHNKVCNFIIQKEKEKKTVFLKNGGVSGGWGITEVWGRTILKVD